MPPVLQPVVVEMIDFARLGGFGGIMVNGRFPGAAFFPPESAAEDSGHQAVETAGVSVSSQACTVRSVLLSNLT